MASDRPARDKLVAFLQTHPDVLSVLRETGAEGDTTAHRLTQHITGLVDRGQLGICAACSGTGGGHPDDPCRCSACGGTGWEGVRDAEV